MKNILVPTDFSKNCNKAEELGIEMAKLYNSEIHFFHVFPFVVFLYSLDTFCVSILQELEFQMIDKINSCPHWEGRCGYRSR